MIFWKYFKRKTWKKNQEMTLKDYVERKLCLCLFSVSNDGKHVKITLNRDESQQNEKEADNLFNNYVEKNRIVQYYNYRSGLYKFYNRKRIIQQKLETKSTYPFDIDSLVATIYFIGEDYENKILPPKYFSIIYKLLIDGVLGTGHEDLNATTFRNWMEEYGFTPEGRSSFSKYKPHGKYPNWNYDKSPFKKDKSAKIREAIAFAQKFVAVYENMRLQSGDNNKDKL